MTPRPVAIIIPVRNAAATLAACLRSVFTHTQHPDWRVIVVDDGSSDNGLQAVREFKDVQVIKKRRGGVASALNAGMAAAPGCDVVRLHADVVIETSDWLTRLTEAAGSQPMAGVIGTRLVFPDGRIHSEGRTIVSGLGMHPQHATRRAFQPDGPPGRVQEVDAVPGAFAFYRREVIDQTGVLDENYGAAWMEDDDFCMAARRAGFKVYVHGGVKGVHYTRNLPPTFQACDAGSEPELRKIAALAKIASNRVQAEYWEQKWGWHPFYPDIGEIRRLYGQTEICWQVGEALRYKPSDGWPTVDCCLVTWNTLAPLKRCLESLALTDYPAERLQVYIADNASTDGTAAYLTELAATYPFPIHHLRLAVNTGAALGVNFAVVQGRGDLVARLDDDIVLPPAWLKTLVGDFTRRPFAGCVGPKIINDDARGSVQCGPYRHYPSIYGHDDESDAGQADYLARTVHVRGCCNLYRRDVFDRCGLMDSRYSPSQCDDPDHHIALLQAGYEIIYDGRVRVVHKLNSGLGRSAAAISNQAANNAKMRGKWGPDAYEVLERAIDLSREGRYLPDDGDTSDWLARGPAAADYPRRQAGAGRRMAASLSQVYDDLCLAAARPEMMARVDEYLIRAALCQATGYIRQAADLLLCAANLAPTRPDVLAALAKAYLALGQPELGRTVARAGWNLAPDHAELEQLAQGAAADGDPAAPSMLKRANHIGENDVAVDGPACVSGEGAGLRVLMVNTYEPRLSGGDMQQIKKTRQYLQQLGVHVDVCCQPRPDPRGYDLIHVWNTWFPAQTVTQVKAIRAWRPDVPVVLSPIYWDTREKGWADAAVPQVFSQATTPTQLNELLQQLATDRLTVNGCVRSAAREANYRGYETYQRAIFPLVDHLLPLSQAEMVNLKQTLGVEMPFTVVHNGAETGVFDRATPDWFVQTYARKDFVLTVGLVEPRKNQLMLLHALRDTGLPVVVVGRYYDYNYYRLCRKHAPPGTLFIDHLPHDRLASAFKAARVHVLPSWMECAAFVNIEAALCGCALAVSDRTSEREYFGADAYYCDPANVASIRTAVVNAFTHHAADAPKRARLINQFRHQYTWKQAAEDTLAGYRAAIAARRPAATPTNHLQPPIFKP